MTILNRISIIAAVSFSVALAVAVALKASGTTQLMLAGALIGVTVAIPTTAVILIRWLQHDASGAQATATPPVTVNHYYHQYQPRTVVVVVNVPSDANDVTRRMVVADELRVSPREAKRMIDAGEVRCLPAGR